MNKLKIFQVTVCIVMLISSAGKAFAEPEEVLTLFFEALQHGEVETAYAFVAGEEPDKLPFYDFLLLAYDVSYIDLAYYQSFIVYMGPHIRYEAEMLTIEADKADFMVTIYMPDSEDYFMRLREAGEAFETPFRPVTRARQQIFRLINQKNGAWRIVLP